MRGDNRIKRALRERQAITVSVLRARIAGGKPLPSAVALARAARMSRVTAWRMLVKATDAP